MFLSVRRLDAGGSAVTLAQEFVSHHASKAAAM
jgi:hypothetical protein